MRISWAARLTMYFSQPAQYVDSLVQLGGSKPSSSTTSQPFVRKRDCQRDRPCDRACNRIGVRRNEACAMVAQLVVHSANREKTGSGSQHEAQRASPSSSPNTRHCRVCLASYRTTEKYAFAVNMEKLIAIREANWKPISSSSFKGPFRRVWQRRRQQDTRRSNDGYGH